MFNVTIDELLGRIQETTKLIVEEKRRDINKLVLRMRVLSKAGDKVNINLPMPLILAFLNGSNTTTMNINGNDLASFIDFKQIISLVEQGVVGELMDVESANGDIIKVFVE